MRALTSCALGATLVQALETQWRWQVDTVDSIKAAAAELPPTTGPPCGPFSLRPSR